MSLEELAPAAEPTPAPAASPAPPVGEPAPGAEAAAGTGPASSAPEPGRAEQAIDAETVQAGRDIFFNNNNNYWGEQRRVSVRQFSLESGRAVTQTQERWAEEHFAGMEGEADGLVRHLEERRVLLLSADARARKVTAATYLDLRLREHRRCAHPALVFDAAGRHLHVDLRQVIARDELKDRVVVFRRALSRGNQDLVDVFGKTDHAGWTRLTDHLRERNTYLVFTATPAEVKQFEGVHTVSHVHRSLAPHTPDVLARRFDGYLELFRRRDDGAAETLEALRGFRGELAKHFSFAAQLADFASFFLGLGQPALGLDEALALFRDADRRLLRDLDDDLDAWSFGFALTLAQCTPDAAGVSWVDFDRLRRHLLRWLRRDLHLASGPRSEEEDVEPSDVRLELSDDTLLARTCARVEKDPATLADMISFYDGGPPKHLWRTLLERHRRVLTALLPRLRELAERPEPEGRSLSVLAAQIIGRIGEMDPERVVAPLMERWASLGDGRHRGLIGAMLEGVFGSDEPRFRVRCLQELKAMHAGGADADGRGDDRLAAAIAAYSWVGFHDFETAKRELYGIVRSELVPVVEDATRMLRVVASLQREIEKVLGRNDASAVQRVRELRTLVGWIFSERGDVFVSAQFTLASLFATQGVTPLLRALREWIGKGGTSMGVLVALMFLHERGLAAQLRDDRAEFPQGEGFPPAACGQFVRALANDEEDVHQAVGFLGAMYQSVMAQGATEGLVRRLVRERLQAHLLEWIRDAVPVPELAAPVRALVEQLAHTQGRGMHELVVHLVRGDEFRRTLALRDFAATLRIQQVAP
jgi:hypothetical protein